MGVSVSVPLWLLLRTNIPLSSFVYLSLFFSICFTIQVKSLYYKHYKYYRYYKCKPIAFLAVLVDVVDVLL